MRAVNVRTFTRGFPKIRNEQVTVTDRRGRILGTWTPARRKPEPVDFEARAKEVCKVMSPFTAAEILKESRRR